MAFSIIQENKDIQFNEQNNQINDSKFNFDDHEETEIDLREIIKNLFRIT